MSESLVGEIETQHADMVHDAQMDYYGKRLATCSSDRTVKIFDVGEDGQHNLVKELRGHEGPVWMVSWSHPMFGSMLASCSHDRKVIVWKETSAGWDQTREHADHEGSVNAIAWAPHAIGYPMLACASSDGDISILSFKDNKWSAADRIRGAHKNGVMSVSWAPMATVGALGQGGAEEQPTPRLVSCGCDNFVKIWTLKNGIWGANPELLQSHSNWVRDVAWAPSIGLSCSTIASCSQDGEVIVWTQDAELSDQWVANQLHKFSETVWRVSWSITGNILAATTSDNKVTLWKESLDGEWKLVKELQNS